MVNPSLNLCFINKLSRLDTLHRERVRLGSARQQAGPNISIGSQIDVRANGNEKKDDISLEKYVRKCK